jgi:hypothetical protein
VVALVLVVLLWPSGDDVKLAGKGTAPAAQPSETDKTSLSPSPPPVSATRAAARTYPSFPDTVTEVPLWNDAKPPFDLAEFLKAPPDGQNAAPLYLDALSEFSSEVLMTCVWPQREGPSGTEALRLMEVFQQRSDQYSRFEEAWEKDPKSVDHAAVDAWLAEYETGFKKLALAEQRPQCVFQTGRSLQSPFPHIEAAREVARVVTWRTRRDLQRGDFQRPLEDLQTLLRLSRDLRPRGAAVCQLVSIAVDGICCEQMVPAILTAPAVEARHCDRLLTLLAEHEANRIDAFVEGNRADYITARLALHDLQHRTGSFDPQLMQDIWGRSGDMTSPLACFRIFADLGGGSNPEQLAKLAATLQGKLLPGAWSGGKMLSDEDYAHEADALNRFFASILAFAGQPRSLQQERADIEAAETPLLETTLLAKWLIPAESAFLHGIRRNEAILRGTRCLVALRRWQLEHGGPPPDLDTLVKAAGMSQVPTDPYSGRPMLMTTIDERPVIYSVGPDGQDDRALVEWNFSTRNSTGDLLFRLPVPQ